MTTSRPPTRRRRRPPRASIGTVVLPRSVGEGFSLGDAGRFEVLGLAARLVTLAVTDGSRTTRWQLEVDDALRLTAVINTWACCRQSGSALASFEVRVARVATNRASLLIHDPRSLQITRHEPTPTHGSPS